MQLRGPGSFQTDFDSAMLMASKSILVCLSLLPRATSSENSEVAISQEVKLI